MVTGHSKARDELKTSRSSRKSHCLRTVSKSDAETYAKLSKLSAAEFDRAYANEMVKDHEQDVVEFQKEAVGGKDPSLTQFAAKTLRRWSPTCCKLGKCRGRSKLLRESKIARLARRVSLDPFCELTCGFVPSERRSCSHLLGRFRLSLEVKAEVTRAATVGFPAQQAEEHFFHGSAV